MAIALQGHWFWY